MKLATSCMLLTEISAAAKRLGQKKRIRSLGDLDKAALKLTSLLVSNYLPSQS